MCAHEIADGPPVPVVAERRIELARREQHLVEQRGANDRRTAEMEAAAKLVQSQGQTERARLAAESDRVREAARADGVRAVGLANAEAETARLAAYREVPEAVLYALALDKLTGQLPSIGELSITPDVLTKVLGRLGGRP